MRVVVPATSANLGPGFDVFGLALDLVDELAAVALDGPGLRVEIVGEGADSLPRNEDHLIVRTMHRAFDAMGGRPAGLALTCVNRIPHARGLGSSAAAIVAGVLLARAMVVDGPDRLPDASVLDLVATLEGHPDNVAAALMGGFTLSWSDETEAVEEDGRAVLAASAVRLEPHPDLMPIALVPSQGVATKAARALLPESVPHRDAAFNAGRSALLVHAITQDPSLLMTATEDRLHQDARRPAFPRSHDVMSALRAEGVPAVISGAGPTVLALADVRTADVVPGLADADMRVLPLAPDRRGARSSTDG